MLRSSLSRFQKKSFRQLCFVPGVSIVSVISQSYYRSMATRHEVLTVKKIQKMKRATYFPLLFHIRCPSLPHNASARGTYKIFTITMLFFLLQDHSNSSKPPKSSPSSTTEFNPLHPKQSNKSKRPIHLQRLQQNGLMLLPASNATFNETFGATSNAILNPTINTTFSPTFNPIFNPTFNPTINPVFNPTFNPTIKSTFNRQHPDLRKMPCRIERRAQLGSRKRAL